MSDVLKNKRILIIDDEPSILKIVAEILKREGAVPTSMNSVSGGLKTADVEMFDAIILDRYLPECDGHDVLKKLKSAPETKTKPVIMLTGEKNQAEVRKSIELGAVGYIVKPFTPKDFLGQICRILDNKAPIDTEE